MASQVATAYVQIIPSAQGIGGGIAKALGGDAAASEAGASIGGKLVGSIKGILATAGIGAALGKTLTEGAALEQSLGGVETLFKDSASQVIANAERAYKTAGVSANSYMETVTSFSATLLQGLGGDTRAAARIADQALVQMSDNANKMGTSMSVIQYAYQGFARDNYTMLDNLKLGYGGTQAEMARLVNESGVLGDAIQVTDQTVRDVPFDKIIEAIGVIQDRLGITGTTALEAATTLSGAMASVQAAFSNVLANLTLGRDVGPSLDALAETVTTFLVGNLLPAVWNILSALPGALVTFVQSLGPQLVGGLVDGINQAMPGLGSAVAGITATVAGAFVALKALAAGQAIASGILSIATAMKAFVAAASFASSPVALLQGAMIAFANPVTIVVAAVGALTAGFLYLWNTCEPFKQFWLDLGANISAFVSNAGQAIANFFTVTLPNGITTAITWFQQIPANISTFLTQAVTSVGTWVSSMVAKAAEMGSQFLQNVVTFFTQLPYNLGYLLGSALATVASWTINMVNKAVEMGTQFLQNVVTFFVQLPGNIQNFVSAALANVTAWVAQMAQSAVQMGTQFLANVGSFFAQLPGNIANFLSTVLSNVSEWVTSMGQKAAEAASEFGRWLMDGLASLPDRVVEIGRRIVEGLWNGVTGAGGWLQDKIGSFVDGIVDGFQANFDINSPSKVMEDKIGWFLTPGIAQGMMKNMAPLKTAIGVVSDTIQSGFTGKLARLKSTISAGTPRYASAQTSTRGEVLDAIRTAAQMIVTAVQQSGGDLYIGDDVIGRSYDRYSEQQAILLGR